MGNFIGRVELGILWPFYRVSGISGKSRTDLPDQEENIHVL